MKSRVASAHQTYMRRHNIARAHRRIANLLADKAEEGRILGAILGDEDMGPTYQPSERMEAHVEKMRAFLGVPAYEHHGELGVCEVTHHGAFTLAIPARQGWRD